MNSIKAPPLECHGIGELSPQNILGEALSKFQQRLLQHRFRQDQLADQIEYAVDSFRIHSQQVVGAAWCGKNRSEEHTSELQSHSDLVCRLLLEKKTTQMFTAFTTGR